MIKRMSFRIKETYHNINKKIKMLTSIISPTLNSKLMYRRILGESLNLKNPRNFNEKLMWLKLNIYNNNPLITQCADKYQMRDYINKCGYGELLNELIGCWDSVDEIEWEKLPDKFAIKCNHGAGYNIICNDKKQMNVIEVKKTLENWMREDFWKLNAEVNYKNIPKKIICEKYISSSYGLFPVDYKLYCFNGEPLFIGCFIERDNDTREIKRGYFDFDWKLQDFLIDEYKCDCEKFPRPKQLDRMYNIAKDLCKPFPFVRIDFYECKDRLIFGEFTFTPTGCLATYFNKKTLQNLGDLLVLPQKNSN